MTAHTVSFDQRSQKHKVNGKRAFLAIPRLYAIVREIEGAWCPTVGTYFIEPLPKEEGRR